VHLKARWTRMLRIAVDLLAVGLLVLSWFACYLWLMALTEGWGAPWDTTSVRPPPGHWQRRINDFFESDVGMVLPTVIFLTLSVASYLRTLMRTRHLTITSSVFALSNLFALIFLLAITIPVQATLIHTPAHLTPDDWSYWGDFRREWPLILIALLLSGGLLLLQPAGVRRAKEMWDAGHRDQAEAT